MVNGGGQHGGGQRAAQQGWLTEDDKHVLLVTFAGSVAANLATVLAVGAAVALVHYTRSSTANLHIHAVTVLMVGTAVVAVAYGVVALLARALVKRRPDSRRFRLLYLIARVYVALPLLVLVLAVIGVASGFK
jgi:hypothetical protein